MEEKTIYILEALVERTLANVVQICRECGYKDKEKKAIEQFIEECVEKYPKLTRNEIEKLVADVLDRTLNNLKNKNREDDDSR